MTKILEASMLLYLKREWTLNGNIVQAKRRRLKKKEKKKRNKNSFRKTYLNLINLLLKRKAKMMKRKLRSVKMKIKKKMRVM